jgi:hypothetical protein
MAPGPSAQAPIPPLFPHEIGIGLFVFPVGYDNGTVGAIINPASDLCDKAGH